MAIDQLFEPLVVIDPTEARHLPVASNMYLPVGNHMCQPVTSNRNMYPPPTCSQSHVRIYSK